MPIYEYQCPYHGVFAILWRRMPKKVPQVEACLKKTQRAAPEGSVEARCYTVSPLVPSHGSFEVH